MLRGQDQRANEPPGVDMPGHDGVPDELLAMVPDALVGVDGHGVIRVVNERATELFAYPREEMVGRSVTMLLPEGEAVTFADLVARFEDVAARQVIGDDASVHARDSAGREFPVEIALSSVADAQTPLTLASVRDLSSRWASERRFRQLVETAPDAKVVIDETGTIVLVNAQTENLFGYARDQVLGRPLEVLIPERFTHVHQRLRNDFLADPRRRPMGSGMNLFARHRDGHEIPVEISLSPLVTEDGVLVSAAVRDVSERHYAERRFRGLLEAAPDGMVIAETTGSIVLVNAQAELLFGYDRTQMVGRPVQMIIPERFRGDHTAGWQRYLRHPRAVTLGQDTELFALRSDGTEFPMEISLAPLETEEGLLVCAALRDISERRRIQQESDRMKDEFFATVSHELRTPLTSVLGYAELLAELEDSMSEQARTFLSVITRSAEREMRLVDDLLTLVKIESGELNMRPALVDLTALVTEAVDVARGSAQVAGIAVSLSLETGTVALLGDQARLGQMLDGVLSNAVKFTPSGGRVRVRLATQGDGAVVEVADTGPGIPAEEAARVFDRLFRAAAAVADQKPGAGLGLTISRAIAEAHDGRIELDTLPGQGTVVRIMLPMAIPQQSTRA